VRAFLLAWYLYLMVVALLMAASAGRRTPSWLLGLVGGLAAGALALRLLAPGLAPGSAVTLAASVTIALAGLAGLVTARREDTRLIALILAAAGALPVLLYFWSPG
jgi:hypothetical protein